MAWYLLRSSDALGNVCGNAHTPRFHLPSQGEVNGLLTLDDNSFTVDLMSTPLSDPSIIQLQCLLAVVDTGSFAAAGRLLGITTSGVSKTIARLETGQGVRLLHRSTHSLALTEEGELVIEAARDAARGLERLRVAIAEASDDGTTGRIRLTAPVAFVRSQLITLVAGFCAAHPGTIIDIRSSDTMLNLAEEAVDIALRVGELTGVPGHLQQPWFTFGWAACATPGYLAQRGTPVAPSDLKEHDLVGFRNTRTGLVEPWWFKTQSDVQDAQRWGPESKFILDDAESAYRAMVLGLGIAWVPTWLAVDDLNRGAIVEVLTGWSTKRSPMSIVRRDGRLTPKRTQAFITYLKSKAGYFQ
jgi:DNA-binding transcriptional LysR family regulator